MNISIKHKGTEIHISETHNNNRNANTYIKNDVSTVLELIKNAIQERDERNRD